MPALSRTRQRPVHPPQRSLKEARAEYLELCRRSGQLLRELSTVRLRLDEVFAEMGGKHPPLEFIVEAAHT
jgi:hypothetical protein